MLIKNVTTAKRVGKFILRSGHKNKINIEWEPSINNEVLNDDSPRVYLFTIDSEIVKIGGSAQSGGIMGTMSFYTGAMTGSPGVPRYVVHLLIEKALRLGKNVEIYLITSPKVDAKVSGLFEYKTMKIASFKEMETLCKSDYYNIENRYPEWNFQENHEPYPPELARLHNQYHRDRIG